MPAARGRRPPVTLQDFLEFGCGSSSDGFRSYPRCRPCNEEVVLQSPARRLFEFNRSPSWSPSAFFFSKSSRALARIASLSRSFSRRISFWRCRDTEDDDDLDDRDSCGFPSPLVSSCSVSESSEQDIVIEIETSVAAVSTTSSSGARANHYCTVDVPGAAGDEHDEVVDGDPAVGRRNLEAMEDKQRLMSPVSVLDFHFDNDERSDAGTCSTSSFLQHHSHNCHIRRKNKAQQMLHRKIRRFDDDPTTDAVIDLEARFTTTTSESGEESLDNDAHEHLPSNNSSCSTDDSEAAKTTAPRFDYREEHQTIIVERSSSEGQQEPYYDHEYRLLARLLDDDDTAAVDEMSEWLLLDFFAEGIGRTLRSSVVGTMAAQPLDDDVKKVTAALVGAAMDWLRGAGPQWGVRDVMFSGESALKDMGRWTCVREEEKDVGAEVEELVMDGLVDELVTELAPCPAWWCGDGSSWDDQELLHHRER